MKTNKLLTTINNSLIYKNKNLSHHTKSILSKMITDIICGNEEPTFDYVCMNIFGTWPKDIVWDAMQELVDADIMYIDFHEEDEESSESEEDEEYEPELLVFNQEFIEKLCPSLGHCPCCNPAPVNFNVNYN